MKQNSEIRFKCSTEEHDKIKKKAQKVGMSLKQYLLYLGINSTIKVEISNWVFKQEYNSFFMRRRLKKIIIEIPPIYFIEKPLPPILKPIKKPILKRRK